MSNNINREDIRGIQFQMPNLLHAPCRISPPEQVPTGGHAVSNNPLRFSAWPGSDFGVRAPYPAETPLSWDEVQHARTRGLLGPDEDEDDGHGFVRGVA